eukprot:s8301_g1.t1
MPSGPGNVKLHGLGPHGPLRAMARATAVTAVEAGTVGTAGRQGRQGRQGTARPKAGPCTAGVPVSSKAEPPGPAALPAPPPRRGLGFAVCMRESATCGHCGQCSQLGGLALQCLLSACILCILQRFSWGLRRGATSISGLTGISAGRPAAIAAAGSRSCRTGTNVCQLVKPGFRPFRQIASLCKFLAGASRANHELEIWSEFRANWLKVGVLLVCPHVECLDCLEDAILVARRTAYAVPGRTGHCRPVLPSARHEARPQLRRSKWQCLHRNSRQH